MRRVGLAAAAGLLAVAASPVGAPLRELRWVAAGMDPVAAATRRPVECLRPLAAADDRYAVEIGRIAFRTPMLLGGQAARAGLRCESCHRDGRTNPSFAFPGLSGAPGTADVTSALFSTRRDDGVDDPVPIPDLGGDKARLHVDQSPASGKLPAFIHGLVVDEFDGHEPPPAVLAGLAAYVRAMDPATCASTDEAVTVDTGLSDARRAVLAAMEALRRHDAATAALMVEGARWQLGLIDERYALPSLEGERASLRTAALDLTAALSAIRAGDAHAADALAAWLSRQPGWSEPLRRAEPLSLYAPAALRAALVKAALLDAR